MNFFVAMRGYGNQSSTQYGLLSQVIGGVCERQLRSALYEFLKKSFSQYTICRRITAKSSAKMDSPNLTRHNVKRLVDDMKKRNVEGFPIVIAMDCTVIRGRLMHSTEFGSHILGSVLPLSEVGVKEREDIDRIIKEVVDEKLLASQARVLIGKVSNLRAQLRLET